MKPDGTILEFLILAIGIVIGFAGSRALKLDPRRRRRRREVACLLCKTAIQDIDTAVWIHRGCSARARLETEQQEGVERAMRRRGDQKHV